MKILVTGAKGFVGKNLCWALKNIKDGKDRRFPGLTIEEVFEYDLDSTPEELDAWCKDADFVFNLAGVNRPQNQEEFMQGNFGFASTLLDTLKKHGNKCPVMLSSSQQASLTGRFGNSEYGRSKKAGEDLFLDYEREFLKANTNDTNQTNNSGNSSDSRSKGKEPRVLIYRFPNLFGKWCRPNYNSAVATFCNAFANDLPYTVNDPSVELELLYIDDLIDEMIEALQGREHRCEQFCYCPITQKATLGEIVDFVGAPASPFMAPVRFITDGNCIQRNTLILHVIVKAVQVIHVLLVVRRSHVLVCPRIRRSPRSCIQNKVIAGVLFGILCGLYFFIKIV